MGVWGGGGVQRDKDKSETEAVREGHGWLTEGRRCVGLKGAGRAVFKKETMSG